MKLIQMIWFNLLATV